MIRTIANSNSLCSILDLTVQQVGLNVASAAISKTNELAEADQENMPAILLGLQPHVDIDDREHRADTLDDANEAIGAVGGVDLSSLPDLANVSSPTTEY